MTVGRAVARTASLSRSLHARGVLNGLASGGVRKLAGTFAPHGRCVYRNAWGHEIEADLSDYMERVGFFGAHSSRLLRYLTSQLTVGDWAIDAGANVGLVSSPLAAAVGPSGRVWAIEPLPRNVERLRSVKERNALDQLEIFPLALSATQSTARLHLSSLPGGSGSGSFVAPWARDEYVEVPTRTLDDLVAEHDPGRPLRLLKLDVEGFEGAVLDGARKTLSGLRPLVVCEFHDTLLRAAETSADELLEQFSSYDYVPSPPFDRPPGTLDGKVLDLLLVPRDPPHSRR